MSHPRLAVLALTAALALSGCNKASSVDAAAPSAAPMAAVAPPAGKAWSDVVVATAAGGFLMGNANAPVKLLEYGSLSCPHCAKLAQDGAKPLTENYVNTGKVSWEYRSFAIHPQDVPLTMLVRCAPPEAAFPLIEQIYANFEALAKSTEAGAKQLGNMGQVPPQQRFIVMADTLGFTQFFSARGIAVDQAHACLSNAAAAEKVGAESDAASKAGIDSTPTLLINGVQTKVNTWVELAPLLQKAGAR